MENINLIQDQLTKALETRLDSDKHTLEALEDLSTFYTENTLQNRRNLRNEIEKRSVEINKNFLNSFEQLKISFDDVCSEIDEMARNISKMKDSLNNSKALTHELIQQTNSLQTESNVLTVQLQIANSFIKRFQLPPDEIKILNGTRDEPITPEFFNILERVKLIHTDCRFLMQSGYQTAALDIMEEMTMIQETALERLYRWTQNHCRNLDNNEIGSLVIEAMNRLQDRPVLFKYVIDEYAQSRRSVLVRMFIDALTVGGPSGNPKPIENHANDSKRYIGDMFAWLHQAIPNEKDNLLALVKLCNHNDLSEQIQTALAHIADGVSHPLKVRVETILNSEKDVIVLFALSNLLRFYQNIINQVVKGGTLEKCISEVQLYSEQVYLNALTAQVKNILHPIQARGLEAPQRDLVPPASVGKLLNILKEILSVATMVEGRQSDITKIVACVIDPLLKSVTEFASHLPTVDMSVYLLNCLYNMQSTLTVFEYIDERVERLQAQQDAQIDTLSSEQASSLVANLNLGPIYTILQNNEAKIDANLLQAFMDKLNSFLQVPEMLLLPQIYLLISSKHRNTIQKRAFNVIIAMYKQIHERISLQGTEFEKIIQNVKTPEQVAEILTS